MRKSPSTGWNQFKREQRYRRQAKQSGAATHEVNKLDNKMIIRIIINTKNGMKTNHPPTDAQARESSPLVLRKKKKWTEII